MKFEIDFIYKTVLIQAIENGNKEMAKLLLLWNKTDVNLFTISKKILIKLQIGVFLIELRFKF